MHLTKINWLQGWGITGLRLVTGLVFLLNGAHKLFIENFGQLATNIEDLSQLGGLSPLQAALIVSVMEPLCGAALVLGVFTRGASVILAISMMIDIAVFHPPPGFFLKDYGFELALLRLAASVALVLTGPGKAAIDNMLTSWRRRLYFAVAASVMVVMVGTVGVSFASTIGLERVCHGAKKLSEHGLSVPGRLVQRCG